MRFIKVKITLITMSMIVFSIQLYAQNHLPQQSTPEVREDFSDQELTGFVEVLKVQQENQLQLTRAIEEEGLKVEEFNAILEVQQNPELSGKQIPAAKEEKFVNASERVVQIQEESRDDIYQKLDEEGLKMETYNEILMAYQISPKVREKVDSRLDLE